MDISSNENGKWYTGMAGNGNEKPIPAHLYLGVHILPYTSSSYEFLTKSSTDHW